jgi:hypothetical protein
MNEKAFQELFCFILTSARGCVDEPPLYGFFRLLDTYSRLIDVLAGESLDPFWRDQKEQIDNYKTTVMYDQEAFVKSMDQTLVAVAGYIAEKGLE